MQQEDPNQSLGFVLHDTARLLRWNFERRVQGIGLSRAKWSVLAHLKRRDGIQQSELAALLEVKPITLGRMIDRLEEDGWVKRKEDAKDRRAKCVFLTKKVTPILEQMYALGKETREEALKGISKQEQQVFMDLLLRMRANLSEKQKEKTL
jgi:MarR family transcriptional regulator for hemolysin